MEDLKLIKEVEKHKEIYIRGFYYANKAKRAEAWNQICAGLSTRGMIACQTRWRSLRDRFVKIYIKLHMSKDDTIDESTIGWEYYKHLTFLKDHIKSRRNKLINSEIKLETVENSIELDNEHDIPMDSTEDHIYDEDDDDTALSISYDNEATQNHIPAAKKHYAEIKKDYDEDIDKNFTTKKYKRNITESYHQIPTSSTRTDDKHATESRFQDRLLKFMENVQQSSDNKIFKEHDSFLRMLGEKLSELPKMEQDNAKIFFLNHLHNKVKHLNQLKK